MLGSPALDGLLAATALFVLGHFLLSGRALRRPLLQSLGEAGFRVGYSVFVLAAFVWMLAEYSHAPAVPLWQPPDWTRWVALLLMPLSSILVVGGLSQPSPTAVGGERLVERETARRAAVGFLSITRHPFLCGAALWAVLHLLANGDAATAILTTGILVLSVGGMVHIDARRAASLGSAWGPIAMTTSAVPFLAAIERRAPIDWAGLGWWRVGLGLALYAGLLVVHPLIAGVPVLPG